MAKTAKTTSQAQAPSKAKARQSARTQVRRSGVHGKGVYAVQAFEPGDFVIEYKGEHISWEEMQRRHEAKEGDPFHTFFFQTESGNVIDGGGKGRNAARWINHSCEPNCETQEDDDGHVFITAIAPIAPGEEFFYDYALEIDEPLTAELKNDYACRCGSPSCRGTMLKTRRKRVKKSSASAAGPKTAAEQAPQKAPQKAKPQRAAKQPTQQAAKQPVKPAAKQAAKTSVKTSATTSAKTSVKSQAQKASQKAAPKVAKKAVKKPQAKALAQ